MSFVSVTPGVVEDAAHDLAGIRSWLAEAATAVAVPTTGMVAAGQDEVSIALASLFGSHGQEFQAVSAQAQEFHAKFVSLMNAGAAAYLSTEAANAGEALLGGGNVNPLWVGQAAAEDIGVPAE
jgi:PE family